MTFPCVTLRTIQATSRPLPRQPSGPHAAPLFSLFVRVPHSQRLAPGVSLSLLSPSKSLPLCHLANLSTEDKRSPGGLCLVLGVVAGARWQRREHSARPGQERWAQGQRPAPAGRSALPVRVSLLPKSGQIRSVQINECYVCTDPAQGPDTSAARSLPGTPFQPQPVATISCRWRPSCCLLSVFIL